MESYRHNLGKNGSIKLPSGKYTITNSSYSNMEIVGGTNSTMFFELCPKSTVIVDGYNGLTISVNGNCEDAIVEIKRHDNQMMLAGKKFCIDAGHGGKDPGAVNRNLHEKDIALKISMEIATLLRAEGATVFMTRDNDSYPSLSSRASLANKEKCDAFISIHLNSATSKKATGYEVLVYNKKGKANELAEAIIEFLDDLPWPNRGVKERPDLTVLKKTSMPAVLVECGFISNDEEAKTLNMANIQKEIAIAVVNGVMRVYE